MRCFCRLFLVIALYSTVSQLPGATIDTATGGDWIGVYGTAGYLLLDYRGPIDKYGSQSDDLADLPDYVQGHTYQNVTGWYRWDSESSSRQLQDPVNPSGARSLACIFGQEFSIQFSLEDSPALQLAVYAIDPEGVRNEIITATVKQGSNTIALDAASLSSFENGNWAVFDVAALSGLHTLQITVKNNGDTGVSNAIISGVMFSAAVPEPSTLTIVFAGLLGSLVLMQRKLVREGR